MSRARTFCAVCRLAAGLLLATSDFLCVLTHFAPPHTIGILCGFLPICRYIDYLFGVSVAAGTFRPISLLSKLWMSLCVWMCLDFFPCFSRCECCQYTRHVHYDRMRYLMAYKCKSTVCFFFSSCQPQQNLATNTRQVIAKQKRHRFDLDIVIIVMLIIDCDDLAHSLTASCVTFDFDGIWQLCFVFDPTCGFFSTRRKWLWFMVRFNKTDGEFIVPPFPLCVECVVFFFRLYLLF